jgi:hypothetical protein
MTAKTTFALTSLSFVACCAAGSALPSSVTFFREDSGVEPCRARAAASAATTAIRVDELRTRGVIGVLGQPLGVIVKMDATVVAGASLRDKEHRGSYLLRVDEVAGQALREPVLMEFRADFHVGLATDIFGLFELKTGKKTGSLGDPEIAKLEEGYVGQRVSLYAYEDGRFGGVPACMPRESAVLQERAFGFTSSLIVLERLK